MTRNRLSAERQIKAEDVRKLRPEDRTKLVTGVIVAFMNGFDRAGGDAGEVVLRAHYLPNGDLRIELDGMSLDT